MKYIVMIFTVAGIMALGLVAGAVTPPFTEDFTTTDYQGTLSHTVWDTVAGHVTLPPFTPTSVGGVTTAHFARDVAIEGEFAYVADGNQGLTVVNISDAAAPFVVTTMATGNFATGIVVQGDLAYIADGNDGLQIVDVSNPHAPSIVGTYDTPDFAQKVDVSWPYAYVADAATGVVIVDISDPASPSLVNIVATQGNANDVHVDGSHVYIAEGGYGMIALDVSNPLNPFYSSWYTSPGTSYSVAVSGNYAYLAAGNSGLQVYDITNPDNIQFEGSYDTNGSAEDIHIEGNRAYLAATGTGLQVLNIQNPDDPVFMYTFDSQGSVHGVIPRGDLAYLADGFFGLQIVDIGHFSNIYRRGYRFEDSFMPDVCLDGNLCYILSPTGLYVRNIIDPDIFQYLGFYASTSGTPNDIWARGNHAFMGAGTTLEILDVTSPSQIVLEGTYTAGSTITDLSGFGHLVVLLRGSTIEVVDPTDPALPVSVGSLTLPSSAVALHVDGQIAYLSAVTSGVHMVDLSTPASPTLLGTYNTAGKVRDAHADGNLLYLADEYGGFVIVDATNPAAPALLGSAVVADDAMGIHVIGDEAYVIDSADELIRFDVSDPTAPLAVVTRGAPSQSAQVMGNDRFILVHGNNSEESKVEIFQAFQDEVDEESGSAQSSALYGEPLSTIVRVKLGASYDPNVSFRVLSGGTPTFVNPSSGWKKLDNPRVFINWEANLGWQPDVNPELTSLTLDWLYENARILSVVDVPNDQGRQVRLEWKRSAYDFVGETNQIVEYAVYRQFDMGLGKAAAELPDDVSPLVCENAKEMKSSGWDFVTSVPVLAEDYYSVVVPTLADSTVEGGAYQSVYRVTALTATPGLFFHSHPDSGQSIDNLAPSVPANLLWSGPVLSWDEPEDADFKHFTIYGSASSVLDETAVVVGYATGPSFDLTGESHVNYHVTASDFAGNESESASTSGISVVPGVQARFALHPNVPNPFNPSTTIAFELAKPGVVQLRVLDVSGRVVRHLIAGSFHEAGRNEVAWDGRNDDGMTVSAGVYFYRIEAGDFMQTRRMVLIK